jgi:hypothetical protein
MNGRSVDRLICIKGPQKAGGLNLGSQLDTFGRDDRRDTTGSAYSPSSIDLYQRPAVAAGFGCLHTTLRSEHADGSAWNARRFDVRSRRLGR